MRMFKRNFEGVVPKGMLDSLILDYNSREEYDTDSMKKASPQQSGKIMEPLIQNYIGKEWKLKSGNFYKHEKPYLPHTDFRKEYVESVNVVIPLQYDGTQPRFIVFDQWYPEDSVTWCLDVPVIDFSINTGVAGRPCDWPGVKGLTGKPIDDLFYKLYLWRSKEQCNGLSGSAYKFQPGNMIIHNNQLIHCTSKFNGSKLGLTLRFTK